MEAVKYSTFFSWNYHLTSLNFVKQSSKTICKVLVNQTSYIAKNQFWNNTKQITLDRQMAN